MEWSFRNVFSDIQRTIFYVVWLLLHIAYQIQLEVRDYLRFNFKYIKRRLLSCFPLYSQEKELANYAAAVRKLGKVPKHLAISVIADSRETILTTLLQKLWIFGKLTENEKYKKDDVLEADVDGINLHTLSSVIAWASAANIPVISLYDYHGVLKTKFKELGCLIQEDIVQNFWAVKEHANCEKPPIVKFHNVHKSNGYVNGVNGVKPHEVLHIFVYSRDDGKPAIVNAVKEICSGNLETPNDIQNSENSDGAVPASKPSQSNVFVDERILDNYLNRQYRSSTSLVDLKTEPELLIILGTVKSTLGFLPWHIRLTEIHWLPPLKRVELSDFFDSLCKYSRCQQRIGT